MMYAVLLTLVAAHYVTSQKCLTGWDTYKGSCYSFNKELVSWQEAQGYCALYGAALADVNDAEENEWIVNTMKGRSVGSAWIGGSERLHRGTWEWIPSRRLIGKYRNWYGNEPLGVEEDCLHIHIGLGYKWNDFPCEVAQHFICKRSPLASAAEVNPK